jgi:hypothetical protein
MFLNIWSPNGLNCRLDARRDVDAVTEQIAFLHDDVTQVDAHAELHLLPGRQVLVTRLQRRLDFRRAANRFDRAGELGEDRVAGGIEDAPMVLLEQRVEDRAMAAQRLHRRLLVLAHQPAITGDVGGENRGEPALQRRLRVVAGIGFVGHGVLPDRRCSR